MRSYSLNTLERLITTSFVVRLTRLCFDGHSLKKSRASSLFSLQYVPLHFAKYAMLA